MPPLTTPPQGSLLSGKRGETSGDKNRIWRRIENLLRYVAAWLFGFFFFLCVVGIPTLLVVTSTHGLGETVKQRAEKALGGTFYQVSVGRVLFSPTRGFVLDQLEIHDRTPARRLLVSANRLAVSVNMDSILRGKPRLERIFLRNVTLDVPLGPADGPRLRLDHVRGLILCPPGEFRLTEASFDLAGIQIRASGTFLNPKNFSPNAVSSEGPGKTALTIESIQKGLRSIRWDGHAAPVLTIEAGGDLSDTESLSVERAEFESAGGEWNGVRFHHIDIGLHYRKQKLTLENLSLDDGAGVLQAIGRADFHENKASLEFAGAFHGGVLPRLLLAHDKAADWEWIDPCRVNGSMSADWHAGPAVFDGAVEGESGRFRYRGVSMDAFSAGVALHEGKILVRDLHASGDPGSLDADLLLAPGDNRVRLKASLFPGKLAPAASGKLAETLSSMDFTDPLILTFDGGAPGTDPLKIRGSGTLDLGKASMRGAWIESLTSKFQLANGAASFRDIQVRIGEGTGRGEFIYDYKNWEGRFPVVRSTLDPIKLMTWIDPRIAGSLKAYRFTKPPELQISGKVGLHNPDKNDLRIELNARSGLGYTLIGKDLPFGATSGTILLKGQKLAIDLPDSHLFGGSVALKADVSVAPGDSRYGASVHLEKVDFKKLAMLYFDYGESSGSLTADYAFRAVGGDERAMNGRGNLLIENGNVLAMPIFGPLSLLLNEVIPGFGYQNARQATTDFTVENGAITTRNLLIQGKGFNMIGNGTIYYLEDRMSMNMRLNAQGLPGLVLFPVSKIFEYESVGSAKRPKWRPKLLPKGSSSQATEALPAQP